VIGYHRVVEDFDEQARTAIPSLLISTRMLEQHLEWLGRHFAIEPLDKIATELEEGRKPERPVAAITFDDGYSDVYENAFPVLQRRGIPAAVFVVTDLVGTERLPLHDRLYLLLRWAYAGQKRDPETYRNVLSALGLSHVPAFEADWTPLPATRHLLLTASQGEIEGLIEKLVGQAGPPDGPPGTRPLTWEMLARMQAQGVTIGSHTRKHAVLTQETPERLGDEIEGSRRELERRLGIPIRHFAYPDGRFTAPTIEAVKRAGYSYAYTTCRHLDHENPLLTIPRQLLWERSCVDASGAFSPRIMACSVRGVFDFASRCPQRHAIGGSARVRAPHTDPPAEGKRHAA
jgi:peptidoglycan/xylan/chitin deacetylase (PgdA/CDA1 family)